MYKHEFPLLPLTAYMNITTFGNSSNFKFEKAEYDSADKAVYIPDVNSSYFKVKSNTDNGAFIEIPFQGLKSGDYITIEFDVKSASDSELGITLSKLSPYQAGTQQRIKTETYFKRNKISLRLLPNLFSTDFGGSLITFSTIEPNIEYVIKRINVTVHTVNENYTAKQFTQVFGRYEFDSLLSPYTRLTRHIGTTLVDLVKSGNIVFNDNGTVTGTKKPNNGFVGAYALLHSSNGTRNIGVKLRYTCTAALVVNLHYVGDDGVSNVLTKYLDATSTEKDALIFFQHPTVIHDAYISIGSYLGNFVIGGLIIGELLCTNRLIDDFNIINTPIKSIEEDKFMVFKRQTNLSVENNVNKNVTYEAVDNFKGANYAYLNEEGRVTFRKGIYLVLITVNFANNATGQRSVEFSEAKTIIPTDTSMETIITLPYLYRVTTDGATPFHVVKQNSGAPLNMMPIMRVSKLGDVL